VHSAFGADQFNEASPQDRKEKESFFNYFYLAINIGSLVASTVIVWIQDQVHWVTGIAPDNMPSLECLDTWPATQIFQSIWGGRFTGKLVGSGSRVLMVGLVGESVRSAVRLSAKHGPSQRNMGVKHRQLKVEESK
jgi:hypothetical protein